MAIYHIVAAWMSGVGRVAYIGGWAAAAGRCSSRSPRGSSSPSSLLSSRSHRITEERGTWKNQILVIKQIYVAITVCSGFRDELSAGRIFAGIKFQQTDEQNRLSLITEYYTICVCPESQCCGMYVIGRRRIGPPKNFGAAPPMCEGFMLPSWRNKR